MRPVDRSHFVPGKMRLYAHLDMSVKLGRWKKAGSVEEISHVESTTQALTQVADGLVNSDFLVEGDRVLTTDMEHGGGLVAWQHYVDLGLLEAIDYATMPAPPPSAGLS